MRDFRSNNRFGGNRGGGRMMHQAMCDKCGRSCEVPFQPTGEKPVYCNECFAATGGRDGQSRDDRGGYRGAGGNRYSNDGGRPSYQRNSGGMGGGKDYSRDLAAINTKLDKIMKAMGIEDKPAEKVYADEVPAESMETSDDSLMVDDLMSSEE
jgi:CxxC-x17-CxxC domain-containing protein